MWLGGIIEHFKPMKIQGYGIIVTKEGKEYLTSSFSFDESDASVEMNKLPRTVKPRIVKVEMRVKEEDGK